MPATAALAAGNGRDLGARFGQQRQKPTGTNKTARTGRLSSSICPVGTAQRRGGGGLRGCALLCEGRGISLCGGSSYRPLPSPPELLHVLCVHLHMGLERVRASGKPLCFP
jgi:hypothetical protein